MVENLPANAGDARDVGSIPGSGRSPREGNSKSLQYSYLGNPMDRGAWQATAHGFAKSQTGLSYQTAKNKGAGPGTDQRDGLGGLPTRLAVLFAGIIHSISLLLPAPQKW